MPTTVLLVGTRKGCFVLESDGYRRDWSVRGPFCEGWPIYHAVHDPATGTIYAAAASEWHGASVWRSQRPRRDLGAVERGAELRRRQRPQAVEGVRPDGRARAPARRRRVRRDLREPRRRRHLVAPEHARRPARPRLLERPGEPAAGPSRPAGDPAAPGRAVPLLGGRAGLRHLRDDRRRRVVDAAQPGSARGLAAREPGGRLLRPQARDVARRHGPALPAEPRRHAPQRRRRPVVGRDHRGPADRLRLRRRRASPRPRHVLRHPARPRPRALHARRSGRGLAHARRRLELAAARQRPAAARRAPRRAARRARDRHATTCPVSTSARARARSSRAPTRARAGTRSRATCRRSRRSRSRCSTSGRPAPPHDAAAALPGSAATARRRRRHGRRGDRAPRRALARPPRPPVRAGAGAADRTSTSTSIANAPTSTPPSTSARAST